MIGQLAALNRQGLNVEVVLIGLGPIGMALLTQLTYLQRALHQTSGRTMHVTAVDTAMITPAHLQAAYLPEHMLGRPLAAALASRVNLACGLNWTGQTHLPEISRDGMYHGTARVLRIVVSACDTASARISVARLLQSELPAHLWLDLGQDGLMGQAVLGWASRMHFNAEQRNLDRAMPVITELLGDVLTALTDKEQKAAKKVQKKAAQASGRGKLVSPPAPVAARPSAQFSSCGDLIAVLGARLLWSALQPEPLEHHAYFVNHAGEHKDIGSVRVAPPVTVAAPPPATRKPRREKQAAPTAPHSKPKRNKKVLRAPEPDSPDTPTLA